jgi:hypothetical protein
MVERSTTLEELAEHIADPVGAKLTGEEFANVAERIIFAFKQLDVKEAHKAEFERIALEVLKPIQVRLVEPEFTALVNRLVGAMSAFCASDDD